MKNHVLGVTKAIIGVTEYQKRGLPYEHILVIIRDEDKQQSADDYDKVICAEIPSLQNPKARSLVLKFMILGPCGLINPESPCMKDGQCTKTCMKEFSSESVDNDDGYPVYRKRSPEDGGGKTEKRIYKAGEGIVVVPVDSRSVVPYNRNLLLKYQTHINIEFVATVRTVGYLFKCTYKGPDRVMFNIQPASNQ